MAKVKVLIQGYSSADSGGHSCSTVSLVRDAGLKIIVDPGTTPSPETIIGALAKEGLSCDDINVVFLTHNHLDHHRFTGLFKSAKVLDYYGWWAGDTNKECDGKVSDKIQIIKTPGHSYDGMTMLVKTEQGTIALCGDVFWKEGFPKKDPYATDLKKLAQSRKKALKISDFIVPGHGPMFKSK